jgi:hypothetical protein
MNPLDNNDTTDIFWRDIQEDDSIFHEENQARNRTVLIVTNVMNLFSHPRITYAKYVDSLNNRDRSSNEIVLFYAFLT